MNTTSATATRYDVTLKTVEPTHVASIRGVVPSIEQLGDTFDRLFAILEDYVEHNGRRTGPPMAIYHDHGSGPEMLNIRVELAIPFESSDSDTERVGEQVHVYELPRIEEMACVIHKGSFETIGNAYDTLHAWIQENGYKIAGRNREVYLNCGEGDSEDYTTEVQFPVAR